MTQQGMEHNGAETSKQGIEEKEQGVIVEVALKVEVAEQEEIDLESNMVSEDDSEVKLGLQQKQQIQTNIPLKCQEEFYDPTTKEIMIDPVVHPNGTSFERSVAMAEDSSLTYYPNRALKFIIDNETMKLATLKSATSLEENKITDLSTPHPTATTQQNLPDTLFCPITCELIWEPVIDPEGTTYEKEAIHRWVQRNGNSPLTRKPLQVKELYENKTLLNIINKETKRVDRPVRSPVCKCTVEEGKVINNSDVETAATDSDVSDDSSVLQEIEEEDHRRKKFYLAIIVFLFISYLVVFRYYPLLAIFFFAPIILVAACPA